MAQLEAEAIETQGKMRELEARVTSATGPLAVLLNGAWGAGAVPPGGLPG